MDKEKLVKDIIDHKDTLAGNRSTWEAHWQQCAEFSYVEEAVVTSTPVPGAKRTSKVYDSTAILDLELFAAAMHGMLTNPAGTMYSIETEDSDMMEDYGVREWLDEVTKIMHRVTRNTNFHIEVHTEWEHLGCFGTGPFFVLEDVFRGFRCQAKPPVECYIAANSEGEIDTLYRVFKLTARQAKHKWPRQDLGQQIERAITNNKPETVFTFVHALFPRQERDYTSDRAIDMPVASVYICVEDKHIISEGGFQEMPVLVPRWDKASTEEYGRSPTMKILQEIKMLNEMSATNLEAGHALVKPPMQVPSEYEGRVKLYASAINYYDSLKGEFKPIVTVRDLAFPLEMEEKRRSVVDQGYYKHLLQLPLNPNMTATEILERIEEQVRVLGPMVGRLFGEFLNPLVDRKFNLLYRQGYFPPPPRTLLEAPLKVQYLSRWARSQAITEAKAAMQAAEITGPFIEARPELLDNNNLDEMYRDIWEAAGVPQKWLVRKEDVAEVRDARTQAMQQAQMAEEIQQGVESVAKLKQAGVELE